jgi:hypothetical protein
MDKTIAFFGDSFVGQYQGWIEYFCRKYSYKCLSVGKPGADPVYSFLKWKKFNETYDGIVDICIYAHTASDRLFHPDAHMPLVNNVVNDPKKYLRTYSRLSRDEKLTLNAAKQYYNYLSFPEADSIKSIIYPLGIDRFMKENNKVFKKIIHLWSFSLFSKNRRDLNKIEWPLKICSGMDVRLDLTNLSVLEPGNKNEKWINEDTRPLHFSLESNDFIVDIINTAIEKYERQVLDFNLYTDKNSSWEDYVLALEKLKAS